MWQTWSVHQELATAPRTCTCKHWPGLSPNKLPTPNYLFWDVNGTIAYTCLSLGSVSEINSVAKVHLREERVPFIQFTVPSWGEVRQKLRRRPQRNTALCFAVRLRLSHPSLYFLGPACRGLGPPHQSLIKRRSHRHAWGPVRWRYSSQLNSPLLRGL